jgi:4-cresol dehydrogenase (hydroxylating) flavoprotein subunit
VSLQEALAAWRDVLGDEHVTTEAEFLAECETATFHTSQRIPAVIHPGSREEVQQCLRIANRFKTPVYPISAGKNWGYGSRVPVTDACLLALDRLNHILDYDERLAYISVEPGVTFGQANEFLREQRSDLMLNVPGSTADASIVGNVVERGIASGINGERVTQVCALEVVLPDGECIGTGLAGFPNAEAARVVAHGPGPSLDGLFVQSNLGVVTKLTHWLTPLPKFYQYFSFAIKNPAQLGQLIDALQLLKRENLVETNLGLHNNYKRLTYTRHFPLQRSQKHKLDLRSLPEEYLASLEGYTWFGQGAVTAPSNEIGEAKSSLLAQRLAGKVDVLKWKEAGVDSAIIGRSHITSLASAYWRKQTIPENPNPDRDRCGLLWLSPLAPFRGDSITRCLSLIESVISDFQFEPIISIQFHSLRAAHVLASIVYDRNKPAQSEGAIRCHDLLLKNLIAEGFIPYRLTIRGMQTEIMPSNSYTNLLQTLKRLLDPTNILAPDRYV